MRVPLSWLRDFAPFDLDPSELGRVFDELGMVVEGIERVGEGIGDVVVAKVLEIDAIPKADKIRRVVVDDGSGSPVQVVCGAWNFEQGATVAFAPVGVKLPGVDFVLERRKMRGVESNGMICSARELSLGDDHAGIMVLSDSLTPGTPLTEALGIEADVVYDLAIETNRPDANCVAGVARDAAAKLRLPFSLPEPTIARSATKVGDVATIVNESPDLCPRFTATAITGVKVGESPKWVQRRLTLAGMRPISDVVDASNYVMLELGQPTHPYDLDLLPGAGLLVRRARPGEIVVTLDGTERRTGDGDDCLICDATGTPVGIGGIMGGASSEIHDGTSTVLLEAANFNAMAIARTSKRLNLRTEASARFERGVDPEGIERSVLRFCELLSSGEVAEGMLDDRSGVKERERIRVRTSAVNGLLGTDLDPSAIRSYLEPIGFVVEEAGSDLDVVPPSFRPDVLLEVHVTEEVARHHGYENVPRANLHSPQVGALTPYQRDRRLVREILVGAGVDEAQTSSMVGPDDHGRAGLSLPTIAAANAMIREESVLRASLLPGLLRSLAFNAARRSYDVALFEIGNVWRVPSPDRDVTGLDATLPDEREHLGVALAGGRGGAEPTKRLWDVLVDGLRLANVRLEAASEPGLHPTRTARILVDDSAVGVIGELDPRIVTAWALEGRVGWIELDLRRVWAGERRPVEQRPVSRFPSSDIDLAFVVADHIPAAAVEATLRTAAGDLLEDLRLFDVYRGQPMGPRERSLAFRLRFCALDRTLTDDEVGQARAAAIEAVTTAHSARLR